jgi:hypothetical protein
MSSGVRCRCESCGLLAQNPVAGAGFEEWDAEMVSRGWLVERRGVFRTHYCPRCIKPFATMLAVVLAAAEPP